MLIAPPEVIRIRSVGAVLVVTEWTDENGKVITEPLKQ